MVCSNPATTLRERSFRLSGSVERCAPVHLLSVLEGVPDPKFYLFYFIPFQAFVTGFVMTVKNLGLALGQASGQY